MATLRFIRVNNIPRKNKGTSELDQVRQTEGDHLVEGLILFASLT